METPTGVKVLAALSLLGGIISVIAAVALLALPSILPEEMSRMMGLFGLVGATVSIIYAVISFAMAYGLWNGKSWAWWLTVVFSGLGAIGSLLSLNLVLLVINVVILWYMFKPHVKDYFGVQVSFST